MGGLVQFDGSAFSYIDFLGPFGSMMEGQLHCLFGFAFLWKPEAQQTEDCSGREAGTICAEVRTSRTRRKTFQLESLILAQNERWRQA